LPHRRDSFRSLPKDVLRRIFRRLVVLTATARLDVRILFGYARLAINFRERVNDKELTGLPHELPELDTLASGLVTSISRDTSDATSFGGILIAHPAQCDTTMGLPFLVERTPVGSRGRSLRGGVLGVSTAPADTSSSVAAEVTPDATLSFAARVSCALTSHGRSDHGSSIGTAFGLASSAG
jgi:hypothetical protein